MSNISIGVPAANDRNGAQVVLQLRGVTHGFHQGREELHILDGASLTVRAGEIVALMAPSGAGKSTLLQIAGLLEKPQQGEISVAGNPCADLSDDDRTAVRRKLLGFVYQYHHLLPEFSALENIVLPQMIAGVSRKAAIEHGRELLNKMGLLPRLQHRPGQLSGGEQQRVAIARALANSPRLLLADEPTGNLDPTTADTVFAELINLARSEGLAALIATHNPELGKRMDRIVTLKAGKVVGV